MGPVLIDNGLASSPSKEPPRLVPPPFLKRGRSRSRLTLTMAREEMTISSHQGHGACNWRRDKLFGNFQPNPLSVVFRDFPESCSSESAASWWVLGFDYLTQPYIEKDRAQKSRGKICAAFGTAACFQYRPRTSTCAVGPDDFSAAT